MAFTTSIKTLKLTIRLLRNCFRDTTNGHLFCFAKKRIHAVTYTNNLQITQKLYPNDAKVHNLKTAIDAITPVPILPNEIFSFWKIVGQPSKKNGYVASRSIVGNKIQQSVGGGLCQLSGLIYYISLIAGLEVLERYSHSMDIYNETNRFTPLGSDATVVYGYKDLKIRNNRTSPINFSFLLQEDAITIILNYSNHLLKNKVNFTQEETSSTELMVHTFINGEKKVESKYKSLSQRTD
ncbi:MAG: VanW family protein [Bacteroidota bacterium]